MSEVALTPEEKSAAVQKAQMPDAQTSEASKVTGAETMRIKVYSPFKVYFDEVGKSISGVNATGPFDILPRHHNFMTLLQPCELLIRQKDDREQRIRISGGLMHVKADHVTVFLDI
ncbi:MAG TPA: F0F1 ATP synthase subunit epsilon [Candidatus Saccharimonadales bacterium]